MKKLYYILSIILFATEALAQGPGVGPAPGIALQDEGVAQGRVQILNCTGAGITCSKSGVTGTLNATGGSGSFALTTVEIDFEVDAKFVAKLTVVDAAVTATSKIIALQSGIAATGRQADENEMDAIVCSATPAAGSFILQCACSRSVTHGLFKVNYTIG
jgi:hypothetical protein